MDPIEYLKATNILKLTSAARMAGLRWKSGAPGYDKAGIIARLAESPSIMRACIAVLQRMETAPSAPNPFADDIADEQAHPLVTAAPVAPQALKTTGSEVEGSESLRASIDQALRHIGGLRADLQKLDAGKADKTEVGRMVREVIEPVAAKVSDAFKSLTARMDEIEKRAPIVFNIEGREIGPISGQHHMFPRMVKWLSMRKIDPQTRKGPRTHVLLVGPASSGKTTAALEYAKLMGLELYSQPLSMDSFAVIGYTSPDGKRIETEFTRAWINGGIFLWDELSMSSPEAIGTLNSALANGFISIPGLGTVYAHPDFYMIAGDNSDTGASLKYGARSLLDGASLDRFIRLEWNIDPDIERQVAGTATSWLAAVRAIRAEIDKRDIAHVGATMRAVITGAMALQSGVFSRLEILEDTCKKGALCEQWDYFKNLPAVQTFLRGQ